MNAIVIKKMINCSKLPDNKAQALVELAIFGSILLLCVAVLIQYGLEGNYSQQAQMEAFRKALKLAYHKTGLGSSSAIVLVKDKPIPDPRDQWGFAERSPVMGSGSAVWDTHLGEQYVLSFNGTIMEKDVPTAYFEIDKATPPSQAKAGVPSDPSLTQAFGFYTAQFEKVDCSKLGAIYVVIDNPSCPGISSTCNDYLIKQIPCDQIKVMTLDGGDGNPTGDIGDEQEILMSPYYKDNGLKRRIISADLDSNYELRDGRLECVAGDCEVEEIIAANCSPELEYRIKTFFYMDRSSKKDVALKDGSRYGPGEIQIDSTYAGLQPYPYGPSGATINDKQGMLGDFDKTTTHSGSSIVKTQTAQPRSITSRTTLKASQKITHKIKLNDGTVLGIPADFVVNKSDLYNWTTVN